LNTLGPSVTSPSKEHKGSSCARDKKRPTSTPPQKPITVVEEFNIKLTESDLNRLNDGEQLNDQIINFYMELINQREQRSLQPCQEPTASIHFAMKSCQDVKPSG